MYFAQPGPAGIGVARTYGRITALGCRTSRWTAERLAAERLRQVRYVASVGQNPDDPIQALVDTLNHSESVRRRAAVDLLAEFEARDRLPDIARLAKDAEWEVRASVAHIAQAGR